KRDVQVLELLEIWVGAPLEEDREPLAQEDTQADARVADGDLVRVVEAAELRIDDRYGARAHDANAAEDVRVPLEDVLVEHRELAVERHVREVQRGAELELGGARGQAGRPTHVEVQ